MLHVTSVTDIAMSKITHEMYGVRTNHVNDNVVFDYAWRTANTEDDDDWINYIMDGRRYSGRNSVIETYFSDITKNHPQTRVSTLYS
jgi:hypothetical protein